MRRTNEKRLLWGLIPVIALALMLCFAGITSEAKTGSWKKDKVGYYYQYSDGTYAKNEWVKWAGHYYYFKASGYMQTGWKQIGTKWFFFNPDGAMVTGWKQIGGKWYHFDSNGRMESGWRKIGGKWYFLKGGVMYTGWMKYQSDYYYFTPKTGAMATGWVQSGSKWYYCKPGTGIMVYGLQTIGGKWYYFDKKTGSMIANKTIGSFRQNYDAKTVGGIVIGKDGVVKYIESATQGRFRYYVRLYANGNIQGSYAEYDHGTSSDYPNEPYAWRLQVTFKGTYEDFHYSYDNTYIFRLKSVSFDPGVKKWYDYNDHLVSTEKGIPEGLKEEWTVGSYFYLYFPGKNFDSINANSWDSRDVGLSDADGRITTFVIDNRSNDSFFRCPAGWR